MHEPAKKDKRCQDQGMLVAQCLHGKDQLCRNVMYVLHFFPERSFSSFATSVPIQAHDLVGVGPTKMLQSFSLQPMSLLANGLILVVGPRVHAIPVECSVRNRQEHRHI